MRRTHVAHVLAPKPIQYRAHHRDYVTHALHDLAKPSYRLSGLSIAMHTPANLHPPRVHKRHLANCERQQIAFRNQHMTPARRTVAVLICTRVFCVHSQCRRCCTLYPLSRSLRTYFRKNDERKYNIYVWVCVSWLHKRGGGGAAGSLFPNAADSFVRYAENKSQPSGCSSANGAHPASGQFACAARLRAGFSPYLIHRLLVCCCTTAASVTTN